MGWHSLAIAGLNLFVLLAGAFLVWFAALGLWVLIIRPLWKMALAGAEMALSWLLKTPEEPDSDEDSSNS